MTAWPPALADLAGELAAACARAFGGARVVSAAPAPGGHSGFTYVLELDREPGAAVARVPPPNARPVGPADVVRQGRIMAALHAAGLPAPAVVASSEAGRPFIVMGLVHGEPAGAALRHQPRERLLVSAVETLAAIHALPAQATGLAGESAHGPLRQVDRWEPLMARGPAELTRRGPELAARLRRRPPAPGRPALVHGDYQLGNLLFAGGRVAAVLDWEIAELGPPEVDIACLCVTAIRRGMPGINPGGEVVTSVAEVLAAAGGGPDLDWYVAAGCYKYAAILAYNLDLHLRGRRIDPVYEDLRGTITGLIERGLEFS
jgi:aminoglycoside phosphotransferase (APT) family kinase protein